MNTTLHVPGEDNGFMTEHVSLLDRSLRRWTKSSLLSDGSEITGLDAARAVFEAPFALVSHETEADPIFNYGNLTALRLFEMTWEEFTRLPSRLSAEPVHRDERQRLMDTVSRQGFISDYQGVRVSRTGRRFFIENAIVWNVLDEAGSLRGQAAMFVDWRFLGGADEREKSK